MPILNSAGKRPCVRTDHQREVAGRQRQGELRCCLSAMPQLCDVCNFGCPHDPASGWVPLPGLNDLLPLRQQLHAGAVRSGLMTYTAMDASQSAWAVQDSQSQLPDVPASVPAPARQSLLQRSASGLAALPSSIRPAPPAEQPQSGSPNLRLPPEIHPAAAAVPDTEDLAAAEPVPPGLPPAGRTEAKLVAHSIPDGHAPGPPQPPALAASAGRAEPSAAAPGAADPAAEQVCASFAPGAWQLTHVTTGSTPHAAPRRLHLAPGTALQATA